MFVYKWDVDQIYLHSAKEVVRAVENDTKSIAKITIQAKLNDSFRNLGKGRVQMN